MKTPKIPAKIVKALLNCGYIKCDTDGVDAPLMMAKHVSVRKRIVFVWGYNGRKFEFHFYGYHRKGYDVMGGARAEQFLGVLMTMGA
jgi:hypothetical protein